MRMTSRKKEILSFFEPEHRQWVTSEIGAPPFDVSGVAYLLHGMESFDKRHQLESTRRTLEAMVSDGLLEKITSYEQRQDTTQSNAGKGVWCNCSRYGLTGTVEVVRDNGGRRGAIEGEAIRVTD
ncbi:hypothetical protein KC222_12010 [Cedecea davisae]|uniref:Uncharacterized protein n=1 Tax=Cedecea davisae TaxID=158484 RepID=A0ABS6DI58_9ENTR|nr:hypothetical protein [Cedecea davisae]MBU4682737.1 hypothetical protein [Cedecea davisae]MBU4686297.1 hypothetical protein [Cedecea davisae]